MKYIHIALLLSFAGCASQAPPGGGPEDKVPPTVLWTLPAADSVRVDGSTLIQIAFSERMNRNSTELSIFISPMPEGEIDFSWNKNVLTLQFEEALPEDRTCVVTVGTDAMDLHGNGLSSSFSFAFSTGDSIDRREITGRVYADRRQNVSVWAYRLGGDTAGNDTAVVSRRADYITQIGSDGTYTLGYLAPSKYRVFAVVDADQDYRYTLASDPIGLPQEDIDLEESMSRTDVDFYIGVEDTTAFRFQSIVMLDRRTLLAGFTQALNQRVTTDLRSHFILRDSASGVVIPVANVFINPARPTEAYLLLRDTLADGTALCRAVGITSMNGEMAETNDLALYVSEGYRPWKTELSMVAPFAGRKVLSTDLLTFYFTGAADTGSFERALAISDSAGRRVRGTMIWTNHGHADFVPLSPWVDRMTYTVVTDSSVLRDWLNRAILDTTFETTFTVFRKDSLGVLSGRIDDKRGFRAPYILHWRPVQKHGQSVRLRLDSSKSFATEDLVAGRYLLDAFQDTDSNGVYTPGRSVSVKFAERFSVYPDTIVIRPNWETTNVILKFK